MMKRRRFLCLAAAMAAHPASGSAAPTRWRGHALGAEAEITVHGPAALAERLIAKALAELGAISDQFSLHDEASALSQLNARGVLAAPDPRMAALLRAVDLVHGATQGRFDPTVQPLWRALALGTDTQAARELIGWGRVTHGPGGIGLGPGQQLTLNGIAQGYATDRIAAIFRDAGAGRTLVNMGEFQAIGGPWDIGVMDPRFGLVATRRARDGAVATSSPGAMVLGATASHIIDPDRGRPLWSTVSVEADNATLADGLSTALCLAGRDEIAALVARLPGLRRVTLVDFDGDIRTLSA
ncbi:hypothetical protein LCGC14_1298460 [marine sediment metagenome]|uniref:FAD:protein FMN transferase n=1 Tax=marine sediment metagenome TaxID=412755 RepID=A0A0F9KRX4_9ZZZZ